MLAKRVNEHQVLISRNLWGTTLPKICSRENSLLLQNMRHQKLSEPAFCKGTHRGYEVRPVKILGFYEACLGQDLISESVRSSYSYIPIRSRRNLHIFGIHLRYFTGFTDS